MRQCDINKEKLMDEIERYKGEPITDKVAERLCVYNGALQALCRNENAPEQVEQTARALRSVYEPTLALDGDTEFERAIMSMPIDWEHMERLIHVFSVHMENLAFANKRAYNSIIDQIRAIAET